MIATLLLVQLGLTLGYGLLRLLARVRLPPARLVAASRVLLAVALISPIWALALPNPPGWRPPVQVHDASGGGATVAMRLGSALDPAVVMPLAGSRAGQLDQAAALLGAGLLLSMLFAAFLRLGRASVQLHASLGRTQPWRRIGRVQVFSAPQPGVAFAARSPWRPVVVLSAGILADPDRRGLALRHELIHHQHGDVVWAWFWLALRGGLGWNPMVHAWARLAAAHEELACDAAVVAVPSVSARAYGQLLLTAGAYPSSQLAGVAGLSPRSTLKQRLTMLARPPADRPLRAILFTLAGVSTLSMTAWAGRGLAADQRLSTADFAALRSQAAAAGVDVPDAPLIHGELVKMIASSPAYFRRSLARRAAWSELVDGDLSAAGLPSLLAAVPLVESGYTNWGAPGSPEDSSQAPGTIPGRGLWMFIPATARDYGLVVDGTTDQRMDPDAETDAAIALLDDLHQRYGDWGLALAAYNMGPRAVDAAIERGGTKDPWDLTQRGLLNDYAASVMAGALLLQDPSLVDQ